MTRVLLLAAGLIAIGPETAARQTDAPAEPTALAVHLTSPLGRTGVPGRLRIVAQIRACASGSLGPVRFLVDGALLATDSDGPPYAVEWEDENLFEPREIAVEVADSDGHAARDQVRLEPLEIKERTEVTGVLVEAAVYDKKGRFVTNLDASRFSLRENDEEQELDLVAQEAIPATFALLVDASQSLSRRMRFVRDAAVRFTGFLRPRDRVLVVPFSKRLGAVTGPTNDVETVREAIRAIQAGGGTAIFDAIVESARRLATLEGRRAIVLITDGYDEHSSSTVDAALRATKEAQATVYIVGIGGVAGISLNGEHTLRRIAAGTGGRAFFPRRSGDLPAVYDIVGADAQNRYLIAYTPRNQNRDGAWRAISLSARDGDHVVLSRPGYFAPGPPPITASLEFTVTDLDRRYLEVTRDDLIVFEDGVEQDVEKFQEAVAPVSIVLALDASGSMKKSSEAVAAAARSFVESLRPEDSLAVATFADRFTIAHSFAKNRAWSLEAIAAYRAKGGTALYDALCDSIVWLKDTAGRRALVVLSDGRDEDNPGRGPGSVRTLNDVMQALRQADVMVFPVGLGTKVDAPLLRRLADLSGGQAYLPADVSTLADSYAKILENLRRRYVLSYTSTNGARDGSWRNVEIRVRQPGASVASRTGYFAPDR